MSESKRPQREDPDALLARLGEESLLPAPTGQIDRHPDVVADFMRRVCGAQPGEYALNDQSVLSDLDSADTDRLAAYVRDIYGVDLPPGPDQPFVWQIIDRIAAGRE